jgi:hypothetical protein
VKRSALGWAAGALAAAFLIVLGVPREHRALALYAFLLLAGAMVLAGLVALLALAPAGEDDLLEGVPPVPERRPGDLDAIELDVRESLESGAVEDRLRATIRGIAAVRVARRAASDPEVAALLIGDGPLARVLAPQLRGRARVRLRRGEFARAVDELEAL